MSTYHLCLLALAALGTWACTGGATRWQAGLAWLGLGAMLMAMIGGLPGLVLGATVMLVLLPFALRGPAPLLCLHRAASHLCMAGVLFALFLLNGGAICASSSIPLVTPNGMTSLPMDVLAETYLFAIVLGLAAYAAYGLTLCLNGVLRNRPAVIAEVAPMTLATVGMGVGFG